MRRSLLYIGFALAAGLWEWGLHDAWNKCTESCRAIEIGIWVPYVGFPIILGLLLARSNVKEYEYLIGGACCAGASAIAAAAHQFINDPMGDDTPLIAMMILISFGGFGTLFCAGAVAATRILTRQFLRNPQARAKP